MIFCQLGVAYFLSSSPWAILNWGGGGRESEFVMKVLMLAYCQRAYLNIKIIGFGGKDLGL